MKTKKLTLILFGIWFILDFVLTFVGVIFLGAEESNLHAAFFYNLGWYGWLVFPLIALVTIFGYSYLTCIGEKIVNEHCDKKNKKRLGHLVPLLAIITFSALCLYSLVHNINVLLSGV